MIWVPQKGWESVGVAGKGGGGAPSPPAVTWPMIWNVEDETPAAAPTNVLAVDSGVVVGAVSGLVPAGCSQQAGHSSIGAGTSKSLFLAIPTGHEINGSSGSFRLEILYKVSGNGQQGLFTLYDDKDSPLGRLQWKALANQMHDWSWLTGGGGWNNEGHEAVSWSYGDPQSGWCCHQFEVNFSTDTFKSRILARAAPNTGTQDSGWKTHAFTCGITEILAHLRVGAYAGTNAAFQVAQVWMGDIDDTFPDGAEQESNYGL